MVANRGRFERDAVGKPYRWHHHGCLCAVRAFDSSRHSVRAVDYRRTAADLGRMGQEETVVETGHAPSLPSISMANKTFIVKIKRQAAPKSAPYWEEFEFNWRRGMNITSCFMDIAANPVTREGKPTTPIAY